MANEPIVLVDAGRIVQKSKGTLRKTSLNHFKRFLEFTNSQFKELDSIPENQIKDKILGEFSTYLKEHVNGVNQYTTHKNYLSSVHQAIIEKYPLKKVEFEHYYSNLCSTILNQYTTRVVSANSDSVQLVNHHDPIRTSDREFINRVLFEEGDHLTRCWMNLDFTHAGRASEVIQISVAYSSDIIYVMYTFCLIYALCILVH